MAQEKLEKRVNATREWCVPSADDECVFAVNGLMFVRAVCDPYILAWSRSRNAWYYFHTGRHTSQTTRPDDAVVRYGCVDTNSTSTLILQVLSKRNLSTVFDALIFLILVRYVQRDNETRPSLLALGAARCLASRTAERAGIGRW